MRNPAIYSYVVRFGDEALDVGQPDLDRKPLVDAFLPLLRAYVTDTFNRCTFHRERMQNAGFAPHSLQTFVDFERIPVMSSDSATAEFALLTDEHRLAAQDGLLDMPVANRMAKKFTTSGTTGRPKVSYYTQADWDGTIAGTARMLAHIPRENYSRFFNCFHNGHTAGKVWEDSFSRVGCMVENRHFSLQTEEEVLQQIKSGMREKGGFNFLAVPPYFPGGVRKGFTLNGLLEIDLDNYLGSHIRVILTAANWLDDPAYRLRQRMWDANAAAGTPKTQFVDCFGCSEVGTVAGECEYNNGVHLLPGVIYTEVVRADGSHVANGGRGKVLVTGLKHGSRYLRYMVGDEATFVSDPCPCGRTTPRLVHVERVVDQERLSRGCAAG